ncbi:MAG: hypothetical protein ACRDKI_08330 [Solirubrobacterales bacterium]
MRLLRSLTFATTSAVLLCLAATSGAYAAGTPTLNSPASDSSVGSTMHIDYSIPQAVINSTKSISIVGPSIAQVHLGGTTTSGSLDLNVKSLNSSAVAPTTSR